MTVINEPGAESIGAGAPADEIEITPAMIRAGVSAFCGCNSGFETERETVEQIYEAMVRLSPQFRPGGNHKV
jgi:hypothetical protein